MFAIVPLSGTCLHMAFDTSLAGVVSGCRRGVDVENLRQECVAGCTLPCIGQRPPSSIEHVLRTGAAGVVISGARDRAAR